MRSDRVVDLRTKRAGAAHAARPPAQPPRQPQRRISPVRTRRRKSRLVACGVVVIVVIVAACGASYVSYLPQYSVESVNVVGASSVSSALIEAYVDTVIYDGSPHFLSHGNIFLYPRAQIEKDVVAQFPRVSSAQVSRASLLANAITVTISERQPYALWCSDSATCYQMDESGFIFAAAATSTSATSSGEYVFTGSIATSTDPIGQTFAPGHMPGLVTFLQLLGQAGFTAQGANIESDEDFNVPLAQGFLIDASFGEDAGMLVNNLQLVLSSSSTLASNEQSLEYVDLRFGDRVYYKLKGEGEVASSTAQ